MKNETKEHGEAEMTVENKVEKTPSSSISHVSLLPSGHLNGIGKK